MRLRSLTVALAVVPAVLSCALLRHQQVIPDDISGTYRRTHAIKVVTDDGLEDSTVTDSLALSLEKDGSLRFSFELVFDSWHTCAMEGIAAALESFSSTARPSKTPTLPRLSVFYVSDRLRPPLVWKISTGRAAGASASAAFVGESMALSSLGRTDTPRALVDGEPPNNSMQRTALRSAADAGRYTD